MICFCFSDPGGAKPCLAKSVVDGIDSTSMFFSDKYYDFYADFAITPKIVDTNTLHAGFTEIVDLCDQIYTGTSYKSDLEKLFWLEAQHAGIQSVCFIDHLNLIKDRFSYDSTLVYPDIIEYYTDSLLKTVVIFKSAVQTIQS